MTLIDEIKKKIELLKKYDTSFNAFGSKEHKYNLNPPLSESEIIGFEKRENVKLPQGYRDYLLNIGNGGAGPSYGLYSLEEARNGAGWHPPIKDLNRKTEDEKKSPGDLIICNHGCGLLSWLKIIDSLNGEIWTDGRVNGIEPYRIKKDFLNWYKGWLDSAFMEIGFIAHLGNEALALGQKGLFKESIDLFKLAVTIECQDYSDIRNDVKSEYLKIFCNVLYFLQNDNTGLPVDRELNNTFLGKCLSHGKENPAIYFNAACVYNEMKDFHNVLKCIDSAKEYYTEYDMMIETIRTEKVFSEFRKAHNFD